MSLDQLIRYLLGWNPPRHWKPLHRGIIELETYFFISFLEHWYWETLCNCAECICAVITKQGELTSPLDFEFNMQTDMYPRIRNVWGCRMKWTAWLVKPGRATTNMEWKVYPMQHGNTAAFSKLQPRDPETWSSQNWIVIGYVATPCRSLLSSYVSAQPSKADYGGGEDSRASLTRLHLTPTRRGLSSNGDRSPGSVLGYISSPLGFLLIYANTDDATDADEDGFETGDLARV